LCCLLASWLYGEPKQKQGVNYDETFSLAAKKLTVWVMLADAA